MHEESKFSLGPRLAASDGREMEREQEKDRDEKDNTWRKNMGGVAEMHTS